MTGRFKAVLFDVDGTLVDSIPFLVECFRCAVQTALGRTVEDADVRPLVGMPLASMFERVEPGLAEEAAARCVEAYRELYLPTVNARCQLFPDAEPVVAELRRRGYKLAIVSGKTLVGIERILEPTGLLAQFDAVVGADHDGCSGKPAPDGALAAAALLGVGPGEAVVVGDSLLDMEMGRAAGMVTFGVTTGTTGRADLERIADRVVDRLSDVPALLD